MPVKTLPLVDAIPKQSLWVYVVEMPRVIFENGDLQKLFCFFKRKDLLANLIYFSDPIRLSLRGVDCIRVSIPTRGRKLARSSKKQVNSSVSKGVSVYTQVGRTQQLNGRFLRARSMKAFSNCWERMLRVILKVGLDMVMGFSARRQANYIQVFSRVSYWS